MKDNDAISTYGDKLQRIAVLLVNYEEARSKRSRISGELHDIESEIRQIEKEIQSYSILNPKSLIDKLRENEQCKN